MQARSLASNLLGLIGGLLLPFGLYAQTSLNPLTITEAYCVARPLALATDPAALPTLMVSTGLIDSQLKSRSWILYFQGSGGVINVSVTDGVPTIGSGGPKRVVVSGIPYSPPM